MIDVQKPPYGRVSVQFELAKRLVDWMHADPHGSAPLPKWEEMTPQQRETFTSALTNVDIPLVLFALAYRLETDKEYRTYLQSLSGTKSLKTNVEPIG